jgi:hypothetical protein
MNKLDIAKVAYSVNRKYCEALGDLSQASWEDAADWQKDSVIKGVEFHLENENATPWASHDSWLAVKQAEGWKWGAVKDADKKEHPCFCSYQELPQSQRAKDYIFAAIVDALKEHLD